MQVNLVPLYGYAINYVGKLRPIIWVERSLKGFILEVLRMFDVVYLDSNELQFETPTKIR